MMNYIYIICFFPVLIIMNNCNGKNNNPSDDKVKNSLLDLKEQSIKEEGRDCVDFVALWSALDISQKTGQSKKWIFLHYTVDIWDAPPSKYKGSILGILRASSYARLIDTNGEDYLVESPIDATQGWINKEHVKSIVKKNQQTRKLCE